MRQTIFVTLWSIIFAPTLLGQTGSINNTLGSGGAFRIKGTASDSLLIVKDNGNVGVGTTSPASKLDVAGQLTTDQVKVEGIPSFFATHVSEDSLTSPHVLSSWNEASSTSTHDNSGSFNPSTGEFVAPRDGFYSFTGHIGLFGAGNNGATLYVNVNGSSTGLYGYTPTSYSGSSAMLSVAGVLKLSVGQTVTLEINAPGALATFAAEQGYFSGYLISDF